MKPQISSPEVKTLDLNRILRDATIRVSGYHYVVDFGPDVRPRHHYVNKERRCTCLRGTDCPAVSAVADYLRKGGERAPEPPHGFYPYAPEKCPVCGAPAYFEPKFSSKRRGAGWGCSKTGWVHYFHDRTRIIREALALNPWRFPPVVIRDGQQINAWDGTLPSDTVLYPGLLRADLVTDGPIGYLE
jgi:hypothetical protein